MSHYVICFLIIWYFISQVYYIIAIRKYMKKHSIKDIQKAPKEHQDFANNLFLFCLVSWWRLI